METNEITMDEFNAVKSEYAASKANGHAVGAATRKVAVATYEVTTEAAAITGSFLGGFWDGLMGN